MTKFNIKHSEVNQQPNIYDLRNDLEGMNLELNNLFSNFNAAFNEYVRLNFIHYTKSINEAEISLLKEFKEKHLRSIEQAYKNQEAFIEWFCELNGDEPNSSLWEKQKND
tara:strand:+ start:388 stop:717 length:330 start_codon:yes stop_codon:yes gene_type:complete